MGDRLASVNHTLKRGSKIARERPAHFSHAVRLARPAAYTFVAEPHMRAARGFCICRHRLHLVWLPVARSPVARLFISESTFLGMAAAPAGDRLPLPPRLLHAELPLPALRSRRRPPLLAPLLLAWHTARDLLCTPPLVLHVPRSTDSSTLLALHAQREPFPRPRSRELPGRLSRTPPCRQSRGSPTCRCS